MEYSQFHNQTRSQSRNEITDTHGPLIYWKEAIWSLINEEQKRGNKKEKETENS